MSDDPQTKIEALKKIEDSIADIVAETEKINEVNKKITDATGKVLLTER